MSVTSDSLPIDSKTIEYAQSDAGSTFGYAQQGDEYYFMKCASRGWAYILDMAGQLEDAKLLEETLSDLLFNVLTINQDKVPDAMTACNIIKRTPQLFEQTEDCIFIAVLFTTSQNQNSFLENFWKCLVEDSNSLVMKPKIVLLQEYSDPADMSGVKSDHHAKVVSDSNSRQIPTHRDVLLVHGFGPHYIKFLCEVLAGNRDKDILSMLALIHHKVAIENKCQLSLPFYSSMLVHKLKFSKKKSHIRASKSELDKRLQHLFTKESEFKNEDMLEEISRLLSKEKSNQLTEKETRILKDYKNIYYNSATTSS